MAGSTEECPGQLRMICEQCDGARVIKSDDTPDEVCDFCDGTGIDPEGAFIAVEVRSFWREGRWQESAGDALRLKLDAGSLRASPPEAPGRRL